VRWFYNGNGNGGRLVWKRFMQRTKLAVKTACIALACVGIKCLVYELKNLSANTKVNHSGLLEIMHQYYVCSGSSVKCDYRIRVLYGVDKFNARSRHLNVPNQELCANRFP